MRFISRSTSSKPKISYLWREILIKQDVADFNVSMDDFPLGTYVKIRKPLCYSAYDVETLLPVENLSLVLICLEYKCLLSLEETVRRCKVSQDLLYVLSSICRYIPAFFIMLSSIRSSQRITKYFVVLSLIISTKNDLGLKACPL